jgi:hypothetical protein
VEELPVEAAGAVAGVAAGAGEALSVFAAGALVSVEDDSAEESLLLEA